MILFYPRQANIKFCHPLEKGVGAEIHKLISSQLPSDVSGIVSRQPAMDGFWDLLHALNAAILSWEDRNLMIRAKTWAPGHSRAINRT